jgi:hypothetical protein
LEQLRNQVRRWRSDARVRWHMRSIIVIESAGATPRHSL